MPDLAEASADLTAKYDRQIEAIREDPTLSEEGKQLAAAKVWVDFSDGINAAREREATAANTERQRLEEKYLGPSSHYADTPADRVAKATSYRDALGRAADAGTSEDLAQVLNRAHRSGDTLLARAALSIAFERDDLRVINLYADLNPGTEPDLQRLVNLTGSTSRRRRFATDMATSTRPKPKELGFLLDSDIRELAKR